MSTSAGRVLLLHKGDYDSSETYNPMDEVIYQGSTYVCKQTSTGNAPTNTSYWQMLAQKGENGSGIPTGGTTGQVLTKKSSTNYDADWEDTFSIEDAKDAHILKGKNLAPLTLKSGSKNSVVYTVNADKTISTSGTASADTYITVCDYIDLIPYLDTTVVFSGCTGGSSDWSTYKLRCTLYATNSDIITFYDSYNGTGVNMPLYQENIDHAKVELFVNENQNMDGKTFSPMICSYEDWEESPTYEPHYQTVTEQLPTKLSVKEAQEYELIPQKNKCPFYPYEGQTDGITSSISNSATDEINLNGTANADTYIGYSTPNVLTQHFSLMAGTYVLYCPQGSHTSSSFKVILKNSHGISYATLADGHIYTQFTLNTDDNDLLLGIEIASGTQLSNQKVQVMICTLADWNTSHTYEPYHYTVSEQLTTKISGKKVQGTVSSTSVTFTDSDLTSSSIIDGPYVAGYVMGIASVTPGTGTVTFTFTSADADGETAYIWIRG